MKSIINSFTYANKLYEPYRVSADNGKTWTSQWLTKEEAENQTLSDGTPLIVKKTSVFYCD